MKKISLILLLFAFSTSLFSYELEDSVWLVEEKLDIDGIIEGTEQPIIGERLTYTKSSIIFLEQEGFIKTETSEYWTEDTLYKETRGSQSKGLSFSDFNFDGEYITAIFYKTTGDSFTLGQECFLLSDETMISTYKGCYYLLKRQLATKE